MSGRGARALPFVAASIGANLVLGIVGGLGRLGLLDGAFVARVASTHGQLMTLGFFGGLVGLEAALGQRERGAWVLVVPGAAVLSGLGATFTLEGSAILATLAAVGWGALRVLATNRRSALGVASAVAPALLWATGAIELARGGRMSTTVPALATFLVVTIFGSRLDTREAEEAPAARSPIPRLALAALVSAALARFVRSDVAERVRGASLLLIGAWFLARDVDPAALRAGGIARFRAAARGAAYLWVLVGGALLVAEGALEAGPRFDAAAHALFLGVAVAMVFAQAPVMLPRLAGRAPAYGPELVAPLLALHAGIALRVASDLGWLPTAGQTRNVGASLSAAAIVLFGAAVARRARAVHPPA